MLAGDINGHIFHLLRTYEKRNGIFHGAVITLTIPGVFLFYFFLLYFHIYMHIFTTIYYF